MAKKLKSRPLTLKQKKFIAYYSGNGTDAARKAGYQGDDNVLSSIAYENLRKPEIRAAIKARTDADIEPLVATRINRQKLWSELMYSKYESTKDRLKASELLGRSEADFTDVVKSKVEGVVKIVTATSEQIEESFENFNKKCR